MSILDEVGALLRSARQGCNWRAVIGLSYCKAKIAVAE